MPAQAPAALQELNPRGADSQLSDTVCELEDRRSEVALLRAEIDAAHHEVAIRQGEINELRGEIIALQERMFATGSIEQNRSIAEKNDQIDSAVVDELKQQIFWMRRSPFWRAREFFLAALRRIGWSRRH